MATLFPVKRGCCFSVSLTGIAISRLVAWIAALWLVLCPACSAQELPLEEDPRMRAEWILTINVTRLDTFLNYKGSRLHPVTRLSIAYRHLRPSGERSQPVLYEDLWYHDGKPIGCKRFNNLDIRGGDSILIHVLRTTDVFSETAAVANAIVRCMLDTTLKLSTAQSVIAPSEMLRVLADAMGQYDFFEQTVRPDQAVRASVGVSLRSEPDGEVVNVFYMGKLQGVPGQN